MNRSLMSIGMTCALAVAAYADDKVSPTPGWYLAQSPTESARVLLGSAELIGGPYSTEEACIKDKPRDTIGATYSCVSDYMPEFAVRSANVSSTQSVRPSEDPSASRSPTSR
jgi:hypothetical protein